MKKVISMIVLLVMISGLCAGCKETEADKPKAEVTQQSQKSDDKNWEPETSKQPTTHSDEDDHDHSGHDH